MTTNHKEVLRNWKDFKHKMELDVVQVFIPVTMETDLGDFLGVFGDSALLRKTCVSHKISFKRRYKNNEKLTVCLN